MVAHRRESKKGRKGTRWLCTRCGDWLYAISFYENKRTAAGISAYCKTCTSNYSKEWRLRTYGKLKKRKLVHGKNWYAYHKCTPPKCARCKAFWRRYYRKIKKVPLRV